MLPRKPLKEEELAYAATTVASPSSAKTRPSHKHKHSLATLFFSLAASKRSIIISTTRSLIGRCRRYSVLALLRDSFYRARSPNAIAGAAIQPLPRRRASLFLPRRCCLAVEGTGLEPLDPGAELEGVVLVRVRLRGGDGELAHGGVKGRELAHGGGDAGEGFLVVLLIIFWGFLIRWQSRGLQVIYFLWDSVVFLRSENGELCVGIRRAKKGIGFEVWNSTSGLGSGSIGGSGNCGIGPYGPFSFFLREENKSLRNGGGGGGGGNLSGRAKVRPEAIVEAVTLAAANKPFEVVYYPRASTPEFCIKASFVRAAMRIQWCSGMRFKMAFETEDASRISWFMGTIASVQTLM